MVILVVGVFDLAKNRLFRQSIKYLSVSRQVNSLFQTEFSKEYMLLKRQKFVIVWYQ
jgi:hypothetical protein